VLPINAYRLFDQPPAKFLIPKYGTLPTLFVKVLQRFAVSLKNKLMESSDTAELTDHLFDP